MSDQALRRRLARAKERLDRLQLEITRLGAQPGFALEIVPGSDPTAPAPHYDIRARVHQAPPEEWADEVGEIAYSLRSVLDHLVYQLSLAGGGDPDRVRTQFPIFAKEADYRHKRGTRPAHRDAMLAGVERRNKRLIDQVQPYQRGGSWNRDPLWLLKGLADRDKHQAPHAMFGTVEGLRVELVGPEIAPGAPTTMEIAEQRGTRRRVTDGETLLSVGGLEIGGIPISNPEVRATGNIEVVFGDPPVSMSDLDRIVQAVAGILDRFEGRLPS